MLSRVVNTNKLSDILHISQSSTVKDPLGISGDKNKGDIGTGELIQVLTKFSLRVIMHMPNDSAFSIYLLLYQRLNVYRNLKITCGKYLAWLERSNKSFNN
jgi:hypothetical protein